VARSARCPTGTPTRAAIQRAFASSKAAYAGDAFATVAHRLDDYADRWRAMREASCRATRVAHTQSEALLDARDLCLDRRRDEVVALIAALRATDATTIDKAVEAVGHLGDLAACEPGAAARVEPLPQDPARANAIRNLERELDGLDAGLATGRVADRAPHVADAAPRARATGYRPLAAAAARTEQALAIDRDDWPAAIDAGQRGVEAAEAAGDDALRFEFLCSMIEIDGFRLQKPDEADRARRAAEALYARLGDAPARAARLHCATTISLWWKGDWDVAFDRVKAWVADRERVQPRDDGALARSLHLEAIVDDELGRVDDAWAAESRAIELGVKVFGARHPYIGRFDITAGGVLRELHRDQDAEAKLKDAADILLESQGEIPDVGAALIDLGILYMDEERYADAAATMQRSVVLLERGSAPDHEQVAHALDVLGMALLQSGHPDEGEAAALRSLAMRERAGMADHPGTASAHRSLGKQYRIRKLWDQALAQYAESQRILTAKFGADSPELATTWIGFADIALDRGRSADARAPLERALAMTDTPEAADHKAEVELDLSRALWSTPADRGSRAHARDRRARALAGRRRRAPPPRRRRVARRAQPLITSSCTCRSTRRPPGATAASRRA
jgi:tetratricopeptide (TPR) repeat protein